MSSTSAPTIGWIGTGRMGYAMVTRLLKAGHKVSVYNRTRAKCAPLAEHGATIVDSIAELARCDVVFSMVSASDDLLAVTTGPGGVLAQDVAPRVLVDCSTVDVPASEQVRLAADSLGVGYLAGNVLGGVFAQWAAFDGLAIQTIILAAVGLVAVAALPADPGLGRSGVT